MAATATIRVTKVYPPRNGNPKASWSVVDGDGKYWGFYPDKVGTPATGSVITVEWKGREWQGKEYKDITAIIGESGDTGPTAPKANGHAAPAPRPAHDDATSERIFICGIVNAAIHSQQLDPFDGSRITDACLAAREAYRNIFKGN